MILSLLAFCYTSTESDDPDNVVPEALPTVLHIHEDHSGIVAESTNRETTARITAPQATHSYDKTTAAVHNTPKTALNEIFPTSDSVKILNMQHRQAPCHCHHAGSDTRVQDKRWLQQRWLNGDGLLTSSAMSIQCIMQFSSMTTSSCDLSHAMLCMIHWYAFLQRLPPCNASFDMMARRLPPAVCTMHYHGTTSLSDAHHANALYVIRSRLPQATVHMPLRIP